MTYKTMNNEVWTIDKGDWVSTKYYEKADLIKKARVRNLLLVSSFLVYLVVSLILIIN
jgi:hypothetical protein